MRPIPFRLLIHGATLKHPTGTDAFQKRTYAETALRRVRFEPATRISKTKDNTEKTFGTVLYFDCARSLPRGTEFAPGDRVVFDGTEYEVGGVERLYDSSRLHHFEIGLM